MAHDWLDPLLADTLADYTAAIISGLTSVGKQDLSGDSNIPTGAIQWNVAGDKWEKWSGSAWGDLSSKYLIDVDTVDGVHSSGFALIAHVGAGGVSEHVVATGSVAGFMSAADKTIFDAATSAATASALMKRDGSGRAKVAAPSASDDIARKNETDAVQTNLTSHEGSGGAAHADAIASGADGFMTGSDKAKLNGIEASADVNQTDSELLTQIKNVDGPGSNLDADTVDGLHAADLGVQQTVVNNGPLNSGTISEFTSLPAGIQILWISFYNITLSSNDELQIQLGRASSYRASGYSGSVGNAAGDTAWSSGAIINKSSNSADLWGGVMTIQRVGGNRFGISCVMGENVGTRDSCAAGGFVDVVTELTRIKLMTTGSDTFNGSTAYMTLTYLS